MRDDVEISSSISCQKERFEAILKAKKECVAKFEEEMRELLSPKDIHHRIALAGLGGAGLVSCLNSHEYPKLTSNIENL